MSNPYPARGFARPVHRAFQEGYLKALQEIKDGQLPQDKKKLEELIRETEKRLIPKTL